MTTAIVPAMKMGKTLGDGGEKGSGVARGQVEAAKQVVFPNGAASSLVRNVRFSHKDTIF